MAVGHNTLERDGKAFPEVQTEPSTRITAPTAISQNFEKKKRAAAEKKEKLQYSAYIYNNACRYIYTYTLGARIVVVVVVVAVAALENKEVTCARNIDDYN